MKERIFFIAGVLIGVIAWVLVFPLSQEFSPVIVSPLVSGIVLVGIYSFLRSREEKMRQELKYWSIAKKKDSKLSGALGFSFGILVPFVILIVFLIIRSIHNRILF